MNNQIAAENPITVTAPRIHACGTFCARFDPAHPPTMLPTVIVAAMDKFVKFTKDALPILFPLPGGGGPLN